MPDLPTIHCPCGNTYSLYTHTVCPECHAWPSEGRKAVAVLLEAKRTELRRRLAAREAIAIERETDHIDDGLQYAAREVATLDLMRVRDLLHQVEAALERIRDGSWGICARCEEPIHPARLAVLPWASLCIGCQILAEEENATAVCRETLGSETC